MDINIDNNGVLQFIYSDELQSLMSEGTPVIKRASHVEPGEDGKWYVDLSPVGGPVKIGPFDLRNDALVYEVEWLKNNYIGK